MSNRLVDSPANHGWSDAGGGKWTWNVSGSGGAGAGMVISDSEPTDKIEGMQWLENTTGKVWIWDGSAWFEFPEGKDGKDGADGLWTDNGGSISYNDGNVGIGSNNPDADLHILKNNPDLLLQSNGASAKAKISFLGRDVSAVAHQSEIGTDESSMVFRTGGNSGNSYVPSERMRIDANGEVVVSGAFEVVSGYTRLTGSALYDVSGKGGGEVGIRFLQGAVVPTNGSGQANDAQQDIGAPSYRWRNGYFGGDVLAAKPDAGAGALALGAQAGQTNQGADSVAIGKAAGLTNQGANGIIINSSGKAQNSGNPNHIYIASGDSKYLLYNGSNAWYFSGGPVNGINGFRQNGAPVIDAKGLITTLSTLRKATKDETTLEGMRDALSDAIGGLIENLEHEIATQEISDE